MKLTFLGVGSAFAFSNYQSNMVLEVNGQRLLIDAGSDLRHSLKESGLTPKDVNSVYISHLHADHIGGMEYLAFITYFGGSHKLGLIANSSLIDGLWDSLKGGIASIQNKIVTLSDYFPSITRCGPNGTFKFNGVTFQLVQSVHVMNGFDIVPSYGLIWVAQSGQKVFLTTDSQFCPRQIETFYNDSDIIFQDCEIAKYPSGVHAHYNDLKTLPPEIRAKMWLYHYNDGERPDAVSDGFAGFVQQGQSFDLSVPSH